MSESVPNTLLWYGYTMICNRCEVDELLFQGYLLYFQKIVSFQIETNLFTLNQNLQL